MRSNPPSQLRDARADRSQQQRHDAVQQRVMLFWNGAEGRVMLLMLLLMLMLMLMLMLVLMMMS